MSRSLRFTASVVTPVVAGLIFGARGWLIYALVVSIASFASDTGGRPLARLAHMAFVSGAFALGGLGGTFVAEHPVSIVILFGWAGIVYAMTESLDPLALTASRFLCFGAAIGALYVPLSPINMLALAASCLVTWAISCAWDIASGSWRPSSAPHWQALWHELAVSRFKRWPFALAVACATPLAYLASTSLGNLRPYWAMLTLVLVLRVDFISSRKLMIERFIGTLLGVAIAGGYAAAFSSHEAILIGVVLAALARWPAEQRHGALGVAALTTFVMLVLALVSTAPGEVSAFLKARVIDTIVGCFFAIVALYLDRLFRWVRRRWIVR